MMRKESPFRVSINQIMCYFLCLLVFYPPGLQNLSTQLYSMVKYMLLVVMLLVILMNFRISFHFDSKDKFIWIYLVLMLYFLTINIFKSTDRVLPILGTLVIPSVGLYSLLNKKNIFDTSFWKALVFYCKSMLVLNFVSTLLFPHGMYISSINSSLARANWLLGSKNNMTIYIILFFTIVNLDILYHKRKFSTRVPMAKLLFFLLASLFPIIMCGDNKLGFLTGSSTGIISMVFLCSICLLLVFIDDLNSKFFSALFNPRIMFLITLLASLFLLLGNLPGIVNVITGVLGKTSSFSGRTAIWNSAISYIRKSPLFGYGEVDLVLTKFASTNVTYVYNGFLRLLLSYGFVGLFGFLALMIYPFTTKKTNVYQKACMCGVCAFLIAGMMNEFNYIFILTILFLAHTFQIAPEVDLVHSTVKQTTQIRAVI